MEAATVTREINQLLDWDANPALAAMPAVSSLEHRNGMRHVAVGVSIIAASDGAMRAGLTATAVCSV
ncbi:hypothetical protein, partial [Noviherbaspirillum denitrificans]